MHHLIFVTLLWAFSFSLIGVYLAGSVDLWFAALSRIALATLVFLPFIRWQQTARPVMFRLMTIGAIQIGAMYGFYYHAFVFLTVPEVLLFTVMTPVYITLLNDLFAKRFNARYLLVALIATLGAFVIRLTTPNPDFWLGFMVVQGANLCFALGQVLYKRLAEQHALVHHQCFGFFFIGALAMSSLSFALFGDLNRLPSTQLQWGILIYLGLIASALGYFIWNKGVTLVSVGALAVMNNVLIPAGILVNILIWNRTADLVSLGLGSAIIFLALGVNQYFDARLR
ncbi:DMT family transporter [Pseudoalteromonas ardens]|uniref:Membrane protein n=1 Tax=Pseudoalteromonas rubra TaxID=43658 RepID=A0A0L0EPW3_9GAMM|nr:DMT family transporter [Pseudoalteromonas sp. R96]KNC66454.1 membrane protein [Pseudoalteromonas rubra]MDK1313030.1 DMT family transporter [Pseudoalteromonas sp. R96]